MDEAAAWARAMGVTSSSDWRQRKKTPGFLPADIPANPDNEYGKEFQRRGGWGWFLGTGAVAPGSRKYRSLLASRRWAISQGFKSAAAWFKSAKDGKIPDDIHKNPGKLDPERFRARGGWGWFLGTGNISTHGRQWRSLRASMGWLASRGINTQEKWMAARRRKSFPKDIPTNPAIVYGEAFRRIGGMGGFLNTGRAFRRGGGWRAIEKSAIWAQKQGIRTLREWKVKTKDQRFLPHDIPAALYSAYGDDLRDRGGTRWFFGTIRR